MAVATATLAFSDLYVITVAANEFRCEVTEKHLCEQRVGCRRIPGSVWNTIDTRRETFARCDSRGCDTYPARFSVSGALVNIDVPGRGMVAKMSTGGETFMEAATLGTRVFLSFGTCARQ